MFKVKVMMMIFVINVFRRQGCPHLGQGHGPIVSSRQKLRTKTWFLNLWDAFSNVTGSDIQ